MNIFYNISQAYFVCTIIRIHCGTLKSHASTRRLRHCRVWTSRPFSLIPQRQLNPQLRVRLVHLQTSVCQMIHVLFINQHLQSSADVEQRRCADAENSEKGKKGDGVLRLGVKRNA